MNYDPARNNACLFIKYRNYTSFIYVIKYNGNKDIKLSYKYFM